MNLSRFIQILKIKRQFKDYFSLSEKTLKISKKLVGVIENKWENFSPGAERLCIALFIQTIRLLEAITILCKKGFDEEATILTRSLVENTAYLIFVSEKDSEQRAELYMHSRALSEASAVKEFNSIVPKGEEKVDENFYLERKKEAIKYFRTKYGETITEDDIKKKYALRPRNAAEQLEGEIKEMYVSTYKLFYRPASSITHSEDPLIFLEYKNNRLNLSKWSKGKTTKICLQTTALFTLCSMDNLSNLLKITIALNVNSILDDLFSLIQKTV